ncbi:MAG: hypothetical protein RL318_1805 [Fibrobacterota bacterium]|jgi:hypothetical protein
MLRSLRNLSIPLLALSLAGCGEDSPTSATATPAEPTVTARLIVADSGNGTLRISLDSTGFNGQVSSSELSIAQAPCVPDSVRIESRPGYWVIRNAPDGPWRLATTLRDAKGTVRAQGSLAFARATPITLCNHPMKLGDWVGLLGGNLVIVAATGQAAQSSRDVIIGILAAMTLGSVDIDKLSQLQMSFSNGVYRYGNNPEQILTEFAFVAASPFGNYAVGDTIRENVSNTSSYVSNISLSLKNGLIWDRAPLFGLIQGDVSFSGKTPRFQVDASRLSLTLATRAQVNRPRKSFSVQGDSLIFKAQTPDSLRLRFALPAMRIGALQSALDDGTLSLSHDGTSYTSHADGIQQSFHSSLIRLYKDSLGQAQYQGGYQADAVSGGLQYHHQGHISSTAPQWTLFACDEALTDTLGVAHHARDLTRGSFVTARHDTIPYGLQPY